MSPRILGTEEGNDDLVDESEHFFYLRLFKIRVAGAAYISFEGFLEICQMFINFTNSHHTNLRQSIRH